MECCKSLRYELKMFGFSVEGPTMMLGNNKFVVNSVSLVERTVTRKHKATCLHSIEDAVAAGWLKVGWEPTATKIADVHTKPLPTERRNVLLP